MMTSSDCLKLGTYLGSVVIVVVMLITDGTEAAVAAAAVAAAGAGIGSYVAKRSRA